MARTWNPSRAFEGFGRVKVRPVVILKQGVTKLEGELVNRGTGTVLNSDEAYETVYGQVKEEPLGSLGFVD